MFFTHIFARITNTHKKQAQPQKSILKKLLTLSFETFSSLQITPNSIVSAQYGLKSDFSYFKLIF